MKNTSNSFVSIGSGQNTTPHVVAFNTFVQKYLPEGLDEFSWRSRRSFSPNKELNDVVAILTKEFPFAKVYRNYEEINGCLSMNGFVCIDDVGVFSSWMGGSYSTPEEEFTDGVDSSPSPRSCSFSVVFRHEFISKQDVEGISKRIMKLTEEETAERGTVFVLAQGTQGISFIPMDNKINSPLIKENYSEEVLEQVEVVRKDLVSKNPCGRISIFNGPPGTGKTHLIKALLTEVTATRFVFISPSLLSELSGPSLLPALIDFQCDHKESVTFLVEDADTCLAPRGSDNMSAVTALLNLGDGILGQLIDIRLVLTTNAKRSEMDAAVVRPGRLSALVDVNALDPEQASRVYNRLSGKTIEFDGPRTLAEIYYEVRNPGGMPKKQKNKVGF